jgi:hypothetical protein
MNKSDSKSLREQPSADDESSSPTSSDGTTPPAGSPSGTESAASSPPKSPIALIREKEFLPAEKSSAAGLESQLGIAASIEGSGGLEAPASGLVGTLPQDVAIDYWVNLSAEMREAYYKTIDEYFNNLLEDFREVANEAVEINKLFGRRHVAWRVLLIVSTGILAVINVLAAKNWANFAILGIHLQTALPLLAAVYAAILALLTTLEGFFNYPDKKTSTRQSRELYLDAYRQFEMLRLTQVYPFGYTGQACYNFSKIYQQLVRKDEELRRKILQLTELKRT